MSFTLGAFAAENESGTAADLYISSQLTFSGIGASTPSAWLVEATGLVQAVGESNVDVGLSITATGLIEWISEASGSDLSISATATVNPVGASSQTATFNISSGGLLFLAQPNVTDIGNFNIQSTSTISIFGRSRMVDTRKIGSA